MKANAVFSASAALVLASCVSSAPADGRGELELAKATAGRVAGQPQDCINLRDIKSAGIVDGVAIIYTMTDGTLAVNRPTTGASSLQSSSILLTDTHSGQLCSIDIVRLKDNATQTDIGSVGLGKFVPYPAAGQRG